jgi:hypothetical protein
MASTTYLSPRNSTVMVDREWAQALGLNGLGSARRVGNFYRLPRVAYLRALQTMRDRSADPQVFEAPATVAASGPAPVTAGRPSLSPCMGAAGIEQGRVRRTNRVAVAA